VLHHSRPTFGRRRLWLPAVAVALGALLLAPPATADAPASDPDAAAFEVEFLEMMIDHHQMAVHMSMTCLDKAVNTELGRLCGKIMESQAEEISLMREWLMDWYGIDHEPSMDDPMHHEQMMQLEELSGSEYEIAFLQMMSEHHAMAVVDGQECQSSAEHHELVRLCRSIVLTQRREIRQMEMWLCRWYGDCSFAYFRSA
jgi:uncharacterized protein (DUF305 family)